jgi:ubiquinone/menaquinone biosynthesis C-methylase UbiE
MLLTWLLATCSLADPPEYAGRPIAPVMSWRGATWLEREGREAEEQTARMLRQLPVEPGDTVVDLGCGSGFHARRLARLVGEQGTVHCVDLQPEMLTIARELADAEGLDQIRMVPGQPDRVPLPPGTVDLLLMVDVYHELADPAAMLRSMRESLADDGVVALVEFRLEGATAQHIKREHRMARDQVVQEWTAAGFELVERYDKLPSQHLFLFEAAEPTQPE